MEETKKCPFCGKEILAIAKKCKYCGKWMEEEYASKKQVPCPVCGEIIDSDTTICPHCKEDVSLQLKENAMPSAAIVVDKTKTEPDVPCGKPYKNPVFLGILVILAAFIVIRLLLSSCCYDDASETYSIFGIYLIPIYTNIVLDLMVVAACVLFMYIKKVKFSFGSLKSFLFDLWKCLKYWLSSLLRKLGSKQSQYVLTALLVLAIVVVGITIMERNRIKQKERKELAIKKRLAEVADYEENAVKFKKDASIISIMSDIILKDYHDNWVSAIYDNNAVDINGNKRSCGDFQKAVDWRIEYYSDLGCMDRLDSIESDMSDAFLKMDNLKRIPKKYSTLKESFETIRGKASEAVELCKSPTGNVTEFSATINELLTELTNAIDQTDIYIDSQDTDARVYVSTCLGY